MITSFFHFQGFVIAHVASRLAPKNWWGEVIDSIPYDFSIWSLPKAFYILMLMLLFTVLLIPWLLYFKKENSDWRIFDYLYLEHSPLNPNRIPRRPTFPMPYREFVKHHDWIDQGF